MSARETARAIKETDEPTRTAICALAPSSDNSYLAYPSPLSSPATPFSTAPSNQTAQSGDVLLFDAASLSVTNIVQAHKSPVAFVALNSTGTMLATASDKGTVIRVFGVPNGDRLHEFRRGSYPAKIYSISFNAASTLLCVSSDTETVHIFKLVGPAPKNKRGSSGPDWGAEEQDRFGTPGLSRNGSEASSVGGGGGYDALIESKRKANEGVG